MLNIDSCESNGWTENRGGEGEGIHADMLSREIYI